jgi:glycosyltransferase involved in cell wall biosynthesis
VTFDPRHPLVFVHIPKTAGTSLRRSLEATLGAPGVDGLDRLAFGTLDAWETMAPERREMVLGAGLERLPEGPALVHGHFAYPTTRAAYPNGQMITLLREPRARLLSLWTYWRGLDLTELTPWGRWGDAMHEASIGSLLDFLTATPVIQQLDNMMVRTLLWGDPRIPEDRPIDPYDDEALLTAALERLDELSFVDVVEHVGWPGRLADWLGRPLEMRRLNETGEMWPSRRLDLHAELTPEALALLDRHTRLDAALWRAVVARVLPETDADRLAEASFATTVERHAALLALPAAPASVPADRPEVSVIVPTFRGDRWLAGCLDSVAAQTLARDRYEVVVVHNGPVDGTAVDDWRRAHPEVDLQVLHLDQAGICRALDAGLDAARGRHVTFLEDDDRLGPALLEALLDAAEPGVVPVAPVAHVRDDRPGELDLDHPAGRVFLHLGEVVTEAELPAVTTSLRGALVDADLAREIRFGESSEGLDEAPAFWRALLAAEEEVELRRVPSLPEVAYRHRLRPGTLRYDAEPTWEVDVLRGIDVLERLRGIPVADLDRPLAGEHRARVEQCPEIVPDLYGAVRERRVEALAAQPAAPGAAVVRHRMQLVACWRINRYLRRHPAELDRVLAAVAPLGLDEALAHVVRTGFETAPASAAVGSGLRISVVVPTFRGRDRIAGVLGSLALQSVPHDAFEVVLAHNGPDDGTAEAVADWCREHPTLRVRYLEAATTGPSPARNAGLDAAAAPYVTFVDDDDRVEPYFLQALLSVAAPDVVGGVLVAQVRQGDFERPALDFYATDELLPLRGKQVVTTDLAVFAAYTVAKVVATDRARAVRFDESLTLGEDVLFWTGVIAARPTRLVLADAGAEAAYVTDRRTGSLMRFDEEPSWDYHVAARFPVLTRLATMPAADEAADAIRRRMVDDFSHAFTGKYVRLVPESLPAVVAAYREAAVPGTPWSVPEGEVYVPPVATHPTTPRPDGRPWVSVIVPSYQGEQWVAECLDSLAAQSLDPACFEVVLVQNGPQTGTREVVAGWHAEHPGFPLVYLESDVASVTHARNLGLDAARGEYMTLVDDDDRVGPRLLEGLLSYAAPDAITVTLGAWVEEEDWDHPDFTHWAGGGVLHHLGVPYDDADLTWALQPAWGKLVSTEVARRVRFEDRLARYADDTYFWTSVYATEPLRLQLGELTAEAAYLYRVRAGSISMYGADARRETHLELPLLVADLMAALPAVSSRPDRVRAIVRELSQAFWDRINLYVCQHPQDHDLVVAELQRRQVDIGAWPRINRDVSDRFALVSGDAETGRRFAAHRQVADMMVYTERAAEDPAVAPWVGKLMIVEGSNVLAWQLIALLLDRCLARMLAIEETRRTPYAEIYSGSSGPVVHLVAAMMKLMRPELRWVADVGTATPTSAGQVEDDWVLQVLAAGLAEAGHPVEEVDGMTSFALTVVAALADEVHVGEDLATPSRLPA